jgi:dipeptidyl aminopeptidase/acylaminoacyl peptidase
VITTPALAQTRPPVEAFARLPAYDAPRLSPDGKHFAIIQAVKGLPAAIIYDLSGAGAKPAAIGSDDWIVADIEWAKNDRLAVSAKKSYEVPGDDRVRTWVRQFTVSVSGGDAAILNHNQLSLNANVTGAGIIDSDLDDPDKIFVPLFRYNFLNEDSHAAGRSPDEIDNFQLDLLVVDARTGDSHSFMAGNPNTVAWYMDGHGHVVARIDRTKHPLEDHLKFYDGADWHDAGTFDATADKGSGLVGLSEDGKSAVFQGYNDQGFLAVTTASLAKPGDRSLLFANEHYDIDDELEDEWTGRVVGARYADDRMQYVFFDGAREALQRGLELAFPGVSAHAVSSDSARDRVIVEVEGPKKPVTYYYLDRTTHQAEMIAASYPELSEADLGEMKPYPYKARDGLDIHAYVTLPPGSVGKNVPLVVMPHGGPDARDALGFDWMAQFFANRGYAVFQPNYRGSSGYGAKFTDAGLQQWGLKMQDDITDGVKKLIADGIVDPKRVCIVGASYGGYAALAGATFTPDLYACAVSDAGISDLPVALQTERNDFGRDSSVVSFWTSRIGSAYDDSDKLRATSPARHADQVKCPVLLMHGEGDTTVRIKQSEIEYDALMAAKKNVQFIRVPGEDHYFTRASTRAQFLTEVEKFLAAHIGTTSTASN